MPEDVYETTSKRRDEPLSQAKQSSDPPEVRLPQLKAEKRRIDAQSMAVLKAGKQDAPPTIEYFRLAKRSGEIAVEITEIELELPPRRGNAMLTSSMREVLRAQKDGVLVCSRKIQELEQGS